MTDLVSVWCALAVWCLLLVWRGASGTLLLAYFLGISIVHLPGAINHLGALEVAGEAETELGFATTLFGLAAMLFGYSLLRQARRQKAYSGTQFRRKVPVGQEHRKLRTLGQRLLLIGGLAFFSALPLSYFVSSLTSIVSAFGGLMIIGYWVWLRGASLSRKRKEVTFILISLPLLPLVTLAIDGFAGFGIYFMIAILAYYFQISRARLVLVSLAPIVLLMGLSLGVTYLEGRAKIREVVWYQNVGVAARTSVVLSTLNGIEIYNWNDPDHNYLIDVRLNQNYLVGLAVDNVQRGEVPLAYGGTVPLWSLVPRVFWPGKPAVGGGGDVVSRYTGLYFPPGTSVGAGQPLEFFVNFGFTGLIAGFLFWGMLLARLDEGLSVGLRERDVETTVIYGMPGIALLQPGGNLMEILISFVAAIVAARIFLKVLPKIQNTRIRVRKIVSGVSLLG